MGERVAVRLALRGSDPENRIRCEAILHDCQPRIGAQLGRSAGRTLGIEIQSLEVRRPDDFDGHSKRRDGIARLH
jgi:hypothetical protein